MAESGRCATAPIQRSMVFALLRFSNTRLLENSWHFCAKGASEVR
jgi:hypothetical protein